MLIVVSQTLSSHPGKINGSFSVLDSSCQRFRESQLLALRESLWLYFFLGMAAGHNDRALLVQTNISNNTHIPAPTCQAIKSHPDGKAGGIEMCVQGKCIQQFALRLLAVWLILITQAWKEENDSILQAGSFHSGNWHFICSNNKHLLYIVSQRVWLYFNRSKEMKKRIWNALIYSIGLNLVLHKKNSSCKVKNEKGQFYQEVQTTGFCLASAQLASECEDSWSVRSKSSQKWFSPISKGDEEGGYLKDFWSESCSYEVR